MSNAHTPESTFPWELVPLEEIDLRSYRNARRVVSTAEIVELAGNINEHGLIQPPVLRRKSLATISEQERVRAEGAENGPDPDKGWEVLAGFRRILACSYLYNKSKGRLFAIMPVLVASVDETEARFINLSENIHRNPLKPQEEMDALVELRERGVAPKNIAERLGIKRAWVAQRLSFAKSASNGLRSVLDEGILPFRTAYEVFRSLGGVKAGSDQRQRQDEAASAARLEHERYIANAVARSNGSKRTPVFSERKRSHAVGRAARKQVELLAGAGGKTTATVAAQSDLSTEALQGSRIIARSRVDEIINVLCARFGDTRDPQTLEEAICLGHLEALLCVTLSPSAPDLYGRYVAGCENPLLPSVGTAPGK